MVLQYELADGSVIHKTCTVSTQKYRIKEKLYKSHMIKAAAVKGLSAQTAQNDALDLEDPEEDKPENAEKSQPLSEPTIEIVRLRIIPRTTKHIEAPTEDNETLTHPPSIESKIGGSAKMPIPTLYLGMSRMTPIGEFQTDLIDRRTISKMDEEDKVFIQEAFDKVLPFHKKSDQIVSHSFKDSKKGSHIPAFTHNSFTISLGQDSLSTIVTALASFNHLKRTQASEYNGGILVIDEVDAGLHPRAQEKLIHLLHQSARKLNLQIIITTHSLTVIKSLLHKNEHSGVKVNNVVYLMDSNYPRIMENPTYTKIKNDMLTLPPSEPAPTDIKLW